LKEEQTKKIVYGHIQVGWQAPLQDAQLYAIICARV